jgi:ribosome-binding factor A
MSIRTEKVASLVREEIGLILARKYNDGSYGFLTVTDVKMTADLKIARIYVSILGDPEVRARTLKLFKHHNSEIRQELGSRLRLKFTPEAQFYLDETMDRVERINNLIKEIHKDNH